MSVDNPVCPLDFRYGRKEMKDIFGETSKLQRLLDVEAALARAHAHVGNIPTEAAEEISRKATTQIVTAKRVKEIESEIRHDLMSVTKALAEQCSKESAKYIHLGATSYDIIDTCNALQFQQATDIIKRELKALRKTLIGLADKHRNSLMNGRTHGQYAAPITFGLKMAVFALEVDRHLERLHEASSRIQVGKMCGAVGTGAAMGQKTLEIQSFVMSELKLGFEDGATQIVGRDRYIELISLLGNIATSMEKFATEIRTLQRSEIGEVEESFESKKQVGSSTMPHKRNPIVCEQISGLSRVARSQITVAFENAIQWNERDLANSSSERFMIPHTFILTDWVVFQTNKVFSNLKVNTDKMKRNLENTRGLQMAESLMTALVKEGMGRGDAHELARSAAMKAVEQDSDFLSVLREEETVRSTLSDEQLISVLNPANYLGVTDKIINRAIEKINNS